jgi:hypothetical protein
MTRRFAMAPLLLLSFCLPEAAFAQKASLAGTVQDSSGAAIPSVKVTVQNRGTNAIRTESTDTSGAFRITSLDPGVYDVRIEKQGFKVVEYSEVQLTVDQVLTLHTTLAPSALSEKVTVTGESVAPVDLNDAQIGNIVTSRQIQSLPMILRDPYQLVLLSAGVTQSNSTLGGLSVDGARERNNNFLMDGTDNNDAEIPGLSLPQPGLTALNPDSVQEFRVITSNYLPEFGRNTGAVVDIVSKSGSNTFHGDTYWFGRYDALGARDFFNHEVNSSGQVVSKDHYVRNTFGASAGGPIVHDKSFWFANYEGERFSTTLTNTSTVPNANLDSVYTTGVFTYQGVPVDLSQSSPENYLGLPLDPTIQKILSLYPAPNGPAVDDIRGLLYFPSPSTTAGDNVTVRVDQNFNPHEILSVRYTFNRYQDSDIDHTDFLPALGGTSTLQRKQNVSLSLTSIFGNHLLNDLRLGANRINFPLSCEGLSTLDSVGFTDTYGRGEDFPFPGVSGFGCLFIVDRDQSERLSGTYTVGDDVTWIKGLHTIKTGVEFRDVYSNSTNNFISRNTFDFHNFSNFGVPAFQTGTAIDTNSVLQDTVWSLFGFGSPQQAQFFNAAGARTPDDLRGFRQQEFDAFIQDSFRIRPNLTWSYGMRYEFNGVPYEVNNLLSTLFTSPAGPAPFTFLIAGEKDKGLPPLYSNDWHEFEPRVSIAWDPFRTGKTSIRAGYGIFHDRVFGQLLGLTRGNPPFQQIFFQSAISQPPCGPDEISYPSPLNFCLLPPVSSPATLPPSLSSTPVVQNGALILPFLIDPNLRMPESQSWNFGVQRDLGGGFLFEANYVGVKASRVLRLVDGNPPQPQLVDALIDEGVPLQNLQFDNLWILGATGNSAFLHAELYESTGSSIYHALQSHVTKRIGSGLAFQAAYTWAHAIDDSSDPLVPTGNNQSFPRNSLDLAAERGNSDFDVRQNLTLNYTWDLPVGPGHAHAVSGFAARAFGGWQLAGITVFSGGLPYDILTAVDSAHTGESSRPDYNPSAAPVPITNPLTQTGPNFGLVSNPAFGSAGNLGRNFFRSPGINNWDSVLQKTTQLSERFNLQIRAEFYNLFNRVQFAEPGNLTADPLTFGQSTSQVRRADQTSGARQIQFGMKLGF